MPAYLIANVSITDPARYEDYKAGTPAAIAAHGGRFLVRGGPFTAKEGDPELARVVVVEFPDRAAAEALYHSDTYQELVKIRQSASDGWLIIVDGA